MKHLVYILLTIVFVSSCQNDNKPINYIYSSEQDSIKREEIFAELGDTIFADVRYGMSSNDAWESLNSFKKSLINCYEGFQFADTKFHDFYIKHIESVRTQELESYLYGNIIGYTLFFNDKLFKVTWPPYNVIYSHSNFEDVEKPINDLIAFFEKRYGKPNKKVESVSQLKSDQTTQFAIWKSENRCIEIDVWYEKKRDSGNIFKYKYSYTICVRFYDPIVFEQVKSYIEQRIIRDQELDQYFLQEDSIKSSQAL